MTRTVALLSAGLSACDGQPTALDRVHDAPPHLTAPGHDLELDFPLSLGTEKLRGPAQARTVAPTDVPEDYDLDQALILKATSNPYVGHGSAGNEAKTTFTGNRIKVDVYATVKFLAEPIVSDFLQTTQDTYVFPQTEKRHSAFSRVKIEGPCGHVVSGHAQHIAWIDYGPYEWGETERPSIGTPLSQRACETEEVPPDEREDGGGGSQDPPGEIYTCWYRLYYDLATGEILHSELLYCETL
jgi:hypothetical protein